MSLVLADRVRETTQTTGTGTITLDGAVQGFQSFAVIGNNNTTYYTINRGLEWEVGVGTYYGGTLSRDTVYESSNSNNKVNFSAGSKDVFVTLPSEQAVTSGTDVTFTKVTTPTVQATNSGGLSLKNSAGTTQISMGGGGGDNVSINVATNINGANAQIDISPTGTGHVHIKPTGSGSLEIAPISVGVMDNMTIGATTPAAGTFTTLTATGQTDLGGTSSGQVLRVNALTNPIQYVSIFGSTTGTTQIGAWSTNGSSAGINFQTRGGLGFNFSTNAGSAPQFNIAHTASAVNYVQVTGAATGGNPTISAQGSDATRYLALTGKGSAGVALYSNGGSNLVFLSNHVASSVNYMQVAAAVAGSSPAFSVNGTDTNIDLTLTPKGTGNVRFGTYTGTALSIAGYIEIKDAGGTVRKLAVVA
jgi:hypothetical protein